MATGDVMGASINNTSITNVFNMGTNNGLNKSFTFTDLGIPSGWICGREGSRVYVK